MAGILGVCKTIVSAPKESCEEIVIDKRVKANEHQRRGIFFYPVELAGASFSSRYFSTGVAERLL